MAVTLLRNAPGTLQSTLANQIIVSHRFRFMNQDPVSVHALVIRVHVRTVPEKGGRAKFSSIRWGLKAGKDDIWR